MNDTKPTPRTDAVCELLIGTPIKHPLVALSQQLERELAAIKSQPVPVEPEQIKMMRYDEPEGRSDYERAITDYIDSLQSALKVAQQKRDTVSVPKLVCAICGADRYQEDCKGDKIKCPMAGVAAQEGKK